MTNTDTKILNTIATTRNLNVAAKKLYMHRNSVVYHINKIKEETGLDARVPIELFELLNLHTQRGDIIVTQNN